MAPTVCTESTAHSKLAGVGTGARSASSVNSGGSVARLTVRAASNLGYTYVGPFRVTVFWKPVIVWFKPGSHPAKTYPGLGYACKTIVAFAGKYRSAVELVNTPPTEILPGLWQAESSRQLKNTRPSAYCTSNVTRYSVIAALAVTVTGLKGREPPANSQLRNTYLVRRWRASCIVAGTHSVCLLPAGHSALDACE